MSRMGWIAPLVWVVAAAACGGGSNPPGTSDPGNGNSGDRITGSERLGWNQTADDTAEVNRLRFVAYVDGNRVELNGVMCTGSSSPFLCSSRMPSMTAGSHTIELASYVQADGYQVESARSAPLRVTMVAATAGIDSGRAPASEHVTTDGVALRLDAIATGVERVTALALSDDGLLVIGEREGRIVIASPASMTPAASLAAERPALELADVHLPSSEAGGLLAIALDPAFVRTRFVYALYTVEARDGPRFRIARFRESNRTLGERAVLVDNVEASPERPAGTLAFGTDGKLYATFDDGGDPSQSMRASSYNGKLLRLNGDGTTPEDQATPIVESNLHSPRGFDWHPGSGALWLADATDSAHAMLRVRPPARSRTSPRDLLALPQGTDAAAVAFSKGILMPVLHGDLFVADRQGRQVLRLRIDRRDAMRIVGTERLFGDVTGPVNVVHSGGDGALYLGTNTAVLRIGPR